MTGASSGLRDTRTNVLAAWIEAMHEAKVLMVPRNQIEPQLDGWLALLTDAEADEAWAQKDLLRLVAQHARELGSAGKPASSAVMQIVLLQDALKQLGSLSDKLLPVIREMLRVVADAHAFGHLRESESKHLKTLQNGAPVIKLRRAVIGFLLGPMTSDSIDSLFGRVLRSTVGADANTIVIDVAGAGPDNDTFYRTVLGLQSTAPGNKLRLVISGLRSPETTRQILKDRRADMDKLELTPEINQWLQKYVATAV